MNKEIEKFENSLEGLSYAERQKKTHEYVMTLMGDNNALVILGELAPSMEDIEEYAALMDWWTEEVDKEVANDTDLDYGVLTSLARVRLRKDNPEKWNRLRELEIKFAKRNSRTEVLAAAAHASITEANLRVRLV